LYALASTQVFQGISKPYPISMKVGIAPKKSRNTRQKYFFRNWYREFLFWSVQSHHDIPT